jgi:signal transduction histidine kinase
VVRRRLGRRRCSVCPCVERLVEHDLGRLSVIHGRHVLRGPVAVWLLTATLSGLTLVGLARLGPERAPELVGPYIPWWTLAVAFGLAEIFVIHVRIGRDAQSLSLSEIPLVLGLAYTSPGALVLAQVVGVGTALVLHRRQRAIRTAYNLAQRSVTTTLAIAVFFGLHGVLGAGWPSVWVAAALATLVADVTSALLINTAICLSEGGGGLMDEVIGLGTAFTLVNTALALVAVMVLAVDPFGLILVAAPTAITFFAARAFSDLQRKHEELVLLQRSMQLSEVSLDLGNMVPALLDHVREMFRADVAELVLLPEGADGDHVVTRSGPGDLRSVLHAETMAPDRGVWARVASEREGVLLARPIRNAALAEYYGGRGIVDAIVVPMLSEGEVTGMITVANRLGEFATFDDDDLRLLQVLANHVTVSVRNGRLVERLGAALEHERHVAKLKDDFVGTISHELRTPLTNIQGYVKTLLNPAVSLSPPERHDFLSSVDRQSERLKVLIEDLLFTSRVEASEPRGPIDVVPLGELLERIVRDRAGPDRIERIDVCIAPDLPVVRTRDEDVSRLIGNLVDNALKYSPAPTRIRVETRLEGVGVRISVQDRGPGVPADEQERIFDRFYQVDHGTTRTVGGAGMGLYICKRAAEALGARVWLDDSSSEGSTFCAWLPFDPPRVDPRATDTPGLVGSVA